MGLQETAGVLYRFVDMLRSVLPGIDGNFGVRRKVRNLHCPFVRVRRHVVGCNQYRHFEPAYELAGNGENKVGAIGVHAG